MGCQLSNVLSKIKINLFELILSTILIFYLMWEIYWFAKIGYPFIKWHTRIMFWVYLFIFLSIFLTLIFRVSKKHLYYLAIVFFGFILTEIVLMVSGLNNTVIENNYGFFKSEENNKTRYYWINSKNETKTLKTKEFSYTRNINSLGYSDVEWDFKAGHNLTTILSLGDSFTEGDGAHQDSSYVSFLSRNLKSNIDTNITLLNAGKCGSDPFFNYVNYKDILINFNPQIILQTLSWHDVKYDVALRGGMERFEENYNVKFRNHKNKYLEFVYAVSFTSRIFFKIFKYDQYFQNPLRFKKHRQEDKKKILSLFKNYKDLAEKNGSTLVLVLLPDKNESFKNKYPKEFTALINDLKSIENLIIFDLLVCYQEYFEETKHNIENYYWVYDGHHNAKGYELMAKCIEKGLVKRNLITDQP